MEYKGYKNIRHCGEKGFTLYELLIVVALMAIMMAIGVNALVSQLPKMHMNGTTRDIAGRLMMARLKAVQNNAAYGVSFTPGIAGSYVPMFFNGAWINDGGSTQATTDVTIAVSGALCTSNRTEFYQNGTTGGCDTVTITSNDAQVMTVTVDQTTGNVQVQ